MWNLAVGCSLFLVLAHLMGLSFASPVANGVAILVGAVIAFAALTRLIGHHIARRWLRWIVQTSLGLVAFVATAVGLLGFVLGSTLGRPDYEGHPGAHVCRGWSFGGATVSAKDERIEVVLLRPLGSVLEWQLAQRSWHGDSGDAFEGFWTECAKLSARHGG